tara:strand:- start:1133 stop:1642 length:510 start_codon:yes stop_codon:yes gene_type:complete
MSTEDRIGAKRHEDAQIHGLIDNTNVPKNWLWAGEAWAGINKETARTLHGINPGPELKAVYAVVYHDGAGPYVDANGHLLGTNRLWRMAPECANQISSGYQIPTWVRGPNCRTLPDSQQRDWEAKWDARIAQYLIARRRRFEAQKRSRERRLGRVMHACARPQIANDNV